MKTPASQVARDNWQAYCRLRDYGHADYVAVARKCNDYFLGNQWAPEDKAKLGNRPALTINAVLSTVNAILGEYVSERGEIHFKPRQMQHTETAEVLTKLVLAIQDDNDYDSVERAVFEDGIIQDRGYFDVRIDFHDNLMGEVRITSLDPMDVLLDSQAKEYDPNTWSEVIVSRWMTIDQVASLYGEDKAKQVMGGVATNGSYGVDSVEMIQQEQAFGDAYALNSIPSLSEGDSFIRRVRVIERQYRKTGKATHFIDPETGDSRHAPPHWDEERVAQFAAQHGLELHETREARIRWTVSCNDTLLHDDWSPYRQFTIVPFFPYFRRGRPMGVVRNLLDVQDQLNKVSSQELHVVNTTANSGYILDEGALVNMSEEELERRGAETGLVLVKAQGKEIQKIPPNQIPSGLSHIAAKAAESIRAISGVNTSILGSDAAEVSGVAIQAKQARGMTQMQALFDNLKRSRKMVARTILNLVQSFYVEPRVYRVTRYDTPRPHDEEVAINQPMPGGDIVNNITLGEYDVAVSTVPARETFQDSQFAQAIEMRSAGVMVPDDIVIENSHLARKFEIAEQVRQLTGRGELSPEEQQQVAMQQEIEMRMAMASLSELEAKAAKLQSEAQLAAARAQSEEAGTQLEAARTQGDLQMQVAKLQADIQKTAATLQNKLELAQLHAQNKSHLTTYNATMRRVSAEAQHAHERAMKQVDTLKDLSLAAQPRGATPTQEV